jgi:hypothetical protein
VTVSGRVLGWAALAIAVIAAAVVVPLVALRGGGGGISGGYQFTLPAHWHELQSVPAGVDAAYERDDSTVLLTIRKDRRVPVISKRFIHGLDREFGKHLKGYVPITHRILVTDAGPVFYFAYTQKTNGRLTSIVLVPAHGFSYVLDAVSDPRSKPARRDLVTIIHTFQPKSS